MIAKKIYINNMRSSDENYNWKRQNYYRKNSFTSKLRNLKTKYSYKKECKNLKGPYNTNIDLWIDECTKNIPLVMNKSLHKHFKKCGEKRKKHEEQREKLGLKTDKGHEYAIKKMFKNATLCEKVIEMQKKNKPIYKPVPSYKPVQILNETKKLDSQKQESPPHQKLSQIVNKTDSKNIHNILSKVDFGEKKIDLLLKELKKPQN